MVTVLSSVAVDHLVAAVVSQQRKVDFQHMSAGLNDLEDSLTVMIATFIYLLRFLP